jgi:ribose transport system substrate-binding protein
MRLKKVLGITMAVTMAVGLVGCGSKPSTTTDNSSAKPTQAAQATQAPKAAASSSTKDVSSLKIAYVPTTMNNPFWSAMMGGVKKEMTAKGMNPDKQLLTVDANSDQAKMNNYIYDLINQKVDAIIMAPMDCTACTEALQACADAVDTVLAHIARQKVESKIVVPVEMITKDNISKFNIKQWQ